MTDKVGGEGGEAVVEGSSTELAEGWRVWDSVLRRQRDPLSDAETAGSPLASALSSKDDGCHAWW